MVFEQIRSGKDPGRSRAFRLYRFPPPSRCLPNKSTQNGFVQFRAAASLCMIYAKNRSPLRLMEMEPLSVPRRLLMGSGPSNPEPRVLQALAAAPLAADDPALEVLRDDVDAGTGAVFQASKACGLALGGASRS